MCFQHFCTCHSKRSGLKNHLPIGSHHLFCKTKFVKCFARLVTCCCCICFLPLVLVLTRPLMVCKHWLTALDEDKGSAAGFAGGGESTRAASIASTSDWIEWTIWSCRPRKSFWICSRVEATDSPRVKIVGRKFVPISFLSSKNAPFGLPESGSSKLDIATSPLWASTWREYSSVCLRWWEMPLN